MGVLKDIKESVGLSEDINAFDGEILMYINSAIATLAQNGAVEEGFRIDEDDVEWEDFLPIKIRSHAKEYVFLIVKSMFDNSTTASYVLTMIQEQAKEVLWRIELEMEEGEYNGESSDSTDSDG